MGGIKPPKPTPPLDPPLAGNTRGTDRTLAFPCCFVALTGDSLAGLHDNMAFSTVDSDNDHHRYDCAQMNKGGWWYNSCYTSNLNGFYHMGRYLQRIADGIVWFTLKNDANYSLRKVEMKISPVNV